MARGHRNKLYLLIVTVYEMALTNKNPKKISILWLVELEL
ncbi:hypothetical protein PAE1325 [Pyrobaculum aerophilum str. IM2]|uniref:Uncharacterized protein n=1 Tax=Pyrobaculum aerophilum (strain ATCC 51768 / DSM 7523 / JCM 9630 / CIP 104966 / NBRC 100827 / IM2) TaxID=178306 RepID=Q8ZXE2_PYRAE|nr:hypothetical protein PAE1325 [Pyrobaculum aerophilum str. IM2]